MLPEVSFLALPVQVDLLRAPSTLDTPPGAMPGASILVGQSDEPAPELVEDSHKAGAREALMMAAMRLLSVPGYAARPLVT